jgi:hypothetical protein
MTQGKLSPEEKKELAKQQKEDRIVDVRNAVFGSQETSVMGVLDQSAATTSLSPLSAPRPVIKRCVGHLRVMTMPLIRPPQPDTVHQAQGQRQGQSQLSSAKLEGKPSWWPRYAEIQGSGETCDQRRC